MNQTHAPFCPNCLNMTVIMTADDIHLDLKAEKQSERLGQLKLIMSMFPLNSLPGIIHSTVYPKLIIQAAQ